MRIAFLPTTWMQTLSPSTSYSTIFVNKPNIPRPLRIPPYEILVPRRALILRVPRQHRLNAHAHALDILHRTPALRAQQIETDDAVGIDVRVYGDGAAGRRAGEEEDLRSFDGVVGAEAEAETVYLIQVEGVGV